MKPDPLEFGIEEGLDNALDQISTALAAARVLEKAHSEGVPLNDLVLVNKGGKTQCITRKEATRSNQTKRVELLERLRRRSIRGENNLAEDIAQRITRCRELIDQIVQITSLADKDLVAIRRNLESTHNRAASLVKDVDILENAIQRKKSEDPVITEFESASNEMLEAIRERNLPRIKELRAYCEKNMNLYNVRKNRLKPYLSKAREARMKFISEKRRVMRMEFDLFSLVTETYAKEMSEGRCSFMPEETFSRLTDVINRIRALRSTGREGIDKLNESMENVALTFLGDIENELEQLDTSLLSPTDQSVSLLIELIRSAVESDSSEKSDSSSRKEGAKVYVRKREE